MRYSDTEVMDAARRRIAEIFRTRAGSIQDGHEFGKDLVSGGRSDFRYSELDQVLHDIRDVANKRAIKEIDSGQLVICTVGDYCSHMRESYRTNESEVVNILGLQVDDG